MALDYLQGFLLLAKPVSAEEYFFGRGERKCGRCGEKCQAEVEFAGNILEIVRRLYANWKIININGAQMDFVS
ncbi:hypothetical protein RIVM261_042580 [Rivularia sp. IAM M-261]|nr:hypothetical protein RIVM261_042580 [Rivularia sp. IAM M-261]